MNDEYEGPLTAGSAQTYRRIAGLKVPRAEHKQDEKVTRWNRIWLPTTALFLTLCALIYLDELLDLPHLVLGAPRTAINWQEATLEVIIVAAVGLLAVSRLRRDVAELRRAEAALQPLTARYEAILAAVPDIIMEVDADKVYTWASQAGFEFFGEDVIGQEAAYYFEGEQDTYDVVQPLFNGGENVMYIESWQRRQDGEKRLLAWWCRVLKDAQGNVTGALSTARDITERKRAEEALRESEERFRELAEALPQAICETDATGTITYANYRAFDLFGYNLEDLEQGLKYLQMIAVRDRERAIVNAQTVLAEAKGQTDGTEYVGLRKDGGEFPLVIYSAPIVRKGRVLGMRNVIADITDHKRAEEALREYAEQLEEMVEERTARLRQSEEKSRAQYKGIPVPTYTWQKVGEDFVLVGYNDAAEGITQGKIADFVGTRLADMYRDTPAIREEIERCFAEKTTIEREMPYRLRPTDECKHLAVKYAFVPPDLVLLHTEDITERVQAEEERKKHTAELKRMVNLMAGREVRMAELKEVIRMLHAQLEEAGLEPVADDPLLEHGS